MMQGTDLERAGGSPTRRRLLALLLLGIPALGACGKKGTLRLPEPAPSAPAPAALPDPDADDEAK